MSKSQERGRTKSIKTACTPEEYAEITAKAEAAGLSAGGFLRALGLGRVTAGTKRRASIDYVLLGKAIAELRRVGNNINQLAKAANMQEPADSERLNHALDEYMAALRILREASGR